MVIFDQTLELNTLMLNLCRVNLTRWIIGNNWLIVTAAADQKRNSSFYQSRYDEAINNAGTIKIEMLPISAAGSK